MSEKRVSKQFVGISHYLGIGAPTDYTLGILAEIEKAVPAQELTIGIVSTISINDYMRLVAPEIRRKAKHLLHTGETQNSVYNCDVTLVTSMFIRDHKDKLPIMLAAGGGMAVEEMELMLGTWGINDVTQAKKIIRDRLIYPHIVAQMRKKTLAEVIQEAIAAK